jgi:hypothetical protein
LVLFGVGLILPPATDLSGPAWLSALSALQAGLAAYWADTVQSLVISPTALELDVLYDMPCNEIRRGMLELFSDRSSPVFRPVAKRSGSEWAMYVVPCVATVPVGTAPQFVSKALLPGAPTNPLMQLKHRVESFLETACSVEQAPMMLPPSNWANLFSFVRGMGFRKIARELIQATPEAKTQWSLSFQNKKLTMANFRARKQFEFSFPEETLADIQSLVVPTAQSLSLEFHGNIS